MPSRISADVSASMTEFKRNPMAVVGDEPVAVLSHNRPAFYAIPAMIYEQMLDALEDAELNALADSRMGEEGVEVTLDEL